MSAPATWAQGASGTGGPFGNVDWTRILSPQMPLLEVLVRGTFTYIVLFLLLRIVLKRQASTLNITDLLVLVLVADASQNAMAAGYFSVIDGIELVGVIVFWAWAIDALGYYVPPVRRLLKPSRLALVRDGQLLRRNMRKELVTRDELLMQIREQGVRDLADVEVAYMEPDGRISVLTHDSGARGAPEQDAF